MPGHFVKRQGLKFREMRSAHITSEVEWRQGLWAILHASYVLPTSPTELQNFSRLGFVRQVAFFPESVDFVGEKREQAFELAEPLDGPLMAKFKALAADSSIWLSLGSLHIRDSDPANKKIRNTHVVIDDQGRVAATYEKVHLFDVDIPTFRIKESDFAIPGEKLRVPVQTPVGKVGLAICYDMRFPELALSLAKSGAEVLTYPSAFTVATGYAHWEAILRTRAIETQCYVVAAAQVGQHNPKRSSYGHSVVSRCCLSNNS